LTFTVVSRDSGRRIGIDRDEDGYVDRTELDYAWNPADPLSHGSNAAPRLTVPAGLIVHPGHYVSAFISATDPDASSQRLTFSLGPNAPAGASIDPTTGLFSWTPPVDDVRETNRFIVRVADNGLPVLGDSKSLEVYVNRMRLMQFEVFAPGIVYLAWRAIAGQTYRVQFKERLDQASWADLPDSTITPVGPGANAIDRSAPVRGQRFYRVVLVD
jgi:hypothetical protein